MGVGDFGVRFGPVCTCDETVISVTVVFAVHVGVVAEQDALLL